MTCSYPTCDRDPIYRRMGLCHGHYMQVRRGQELRPLKQRLSTKESDVVDRLMKRMKVDDESGCWVWQGYVGTHGYGTCRMDKRHYQVHRLAYILLVAELPEGSVVHHKCGTKMCINPAHLQAVTPHENVAESFAVRAHERRIKELEARLEACECGAAGE